MFKDTTATQRIFNLTKRIRAVAGGTSASKTISILVWLIDYGQTSNNEVMTVVAESHPHLKLGAIRDFKNIMVSQGYWDDNSWNASNSTYTFPDKTILEFISFDKFGKAHGPRRDILFVNECNNLPYNIVDQLITRTKKVIWLDWNPTNEFWFYTEMKDKRDDIDFITLTYLDCLEALDPNIVKEIESHKPNKGWWQVYGEGRLGELEGKIYKDWAIIDEIPHEARLERRGLDFGYTNDPTAIIDIYKHNNGYILDEVLCRKGMLNKDIADIIKNLDNCLTVADSAEPKSIDEIKSYGINIIGAKKQKKKFAGMPQLGTNESYVKWSIGIVQEQRISMTKRSLNLIKAYRNYLWQTDKEGKVLNAPDHYLSDCMDAVRYGIVSLAPIINKQDFLNNIPIIIRDTEEKNPAR